MGLFDLFNKPIAGVDPGSANLRIASNGNIRYNEPSQISVNAQTNRVSIGNAISTSTNDALIRPVDYTIKDFQAFEMMLRGALKVLERRPHGVLGKSYRLYFALPTSASEVDKRAYRDAAEHAGAVEVYLVHQAICAAVGLNILEEKKHFILIDLGASKVEVTVFANEQIISSGVTVIGVHKLLSYCSNQLRRNYNIDVTQAELETLLKDFQPGSGQAVKIQSARIPLSEFEILIHPIFAIINDQVQETIERVSHDPDIQKILRNGIFLTGGGTQIEFIKRHLVFNQVAVTESRNPRLDNIHGLNKIILAKKRYENYLMT